MVFCYIIYTGPPDCNKQGWANGAGPILTQNVLERVPCVVHSKLEPHRQERPFKEMSFVLLFLLTEIY